MQAVITSITEVRHVPRWDDQGLDPAYRRITKKAFIQLLGMNAVAIAASSHDACVGAKYVLLNMDEIELGDSLLLAQLQMLRAAQQPAANPIFPGSGPITDADIERILGTRTTDDMRVAKGLPDPL